MQQNSAKQQGPGSVGDANASDSEINERLVEILKANAIKLDQPATRQEQESKPGFFAEAYAVLALAGLMIVAYAYSILVNKEA
jgi:hypothetical protein